MFNTRSAASILPCGNSAYWDTLAETNSIAERVLQDATQLHNQYKLLHQRLYQHRV
jgi:hypothetical protein